MQLPGIAGQLLVNLLMVIIAAQPATPRDSEDAERRSQDDSRASDKPNVILIIADDMGYGDAGCYGQDKIQTPEIDRMAAGGILFTQFYAASPVCAPSRCALLTGLHTGHCLIRANGRFGLRDEDLTVAEILKDAGYVNGFVGKWGLGGEGSEGMPTRQGFDYFYGYLEQRHAHNYYPEYLIRNEERVQLRNVVPNAGPLGEGIATERVDYSHDLLTQEALEFIERNTDTPFFLSLSYTVPHLNVQALGAECQAWEVPDCGIYAKRDWPENCRCMAAMISRMDRDIGRILDLLEQLGIDERTVVMFTSDNGPAGSGQGETEFFDSNGHLRGCKCTLYEGGIRVPFIVRWSGVIEPGVVSDHVGYFPDIYATLAELAGRTPLERYDGISFLPTLLGRSDEQEEHEYLFWELCTHGGWLAVHKGDWKAVATPVDIPVAFPFWFSKTRLYNLSDDPGEQNDLAASHPEIVEEMRGIIKRAHVPPVISTFKFTLNKRKYGARALPVIGLVVAAGVLIGLRRRRQTA
jgi:arylsulfatase A-like enzyme